MSFTILLVLGGIIAAGFLGNLFFDRTKIPDVLFLMGIGLLLGPVLKIVPSEALRPAMPYFGLIALVIILFEGGLDLELSHFMTQAGRAILLLLMSFSYCMILTSLALSIGLNLGGMPGLATAVALSCTSAPIIVPILAKIAPKSPLRPLLVTESALSDALAVIIVLTIISTKGSGFTGYHFVADISLKIIIAALGAAVAGWIWLWVLSHYAHRTYFSLLTVGFVFLLIGTVESVHGSGAIAALVFGLVLANGEAFASFLSKNMRDQVAQFFKDQVFHLDPRIKRAQEEFSLLVRSFFFVYIGVVFRYPDFTWQGWATIIALLVIIVATRHLAVIILSFISHSPLEDKRLLREMLPRGLSTAVLATMIASSYSKITIPIEAIAFMVIVLSNLWTTIVIVFRRQPATV